jgi:hypothetical protein
MAGQNGEKAEARFAWLCHCISRVRLAVLNNKNKNQNK